MCRVCLGSAPASSDVARAASERCLLDCDRQIEPAGMEEIGKARRLGTARGRGTLPTAQVLGRE